MSEITTTIEQYRAGDISLDDLTKYLATHTYKVPSRFSDPETKKDALWRAENYDPIEGEDGTWDEVDTAWAQQLLTDDEYLSIVNAADKANPPT